MSQVVPVQSFMATKLHVPHVRPGLVSRGRLLARLDEGAAHRLILISAPAGFGKTTLLADWLGRRSAEDDAVAWLSLDAADSDPAVFWTGVVTAVRLATSGPGTVSAPSKTLVLAAIEAPVPTVLDHLAATSREVLLVLDDYHLVDRPAVTASVALLLDRLPPNAHLVLCTRADPDLALPNWRARGELVEIRAADLRFTPEEAATYLQQAITAPLTGAQVAALEGRTEGWIAALQLAAISLRGRADVAAFVDGFAGDHRFVVDYLVEEVLTRQSPEVRDFLLRSSVLDRLCTSLCDAVLDREDSAQMLRTLERDNLFLVALDDRRQWSRYHQLFADVLRVLLGSEHPGDVALLHERASRWFEEMQLSDPAIRHALAAGSIDRAAALVAAAIPEVRRHRQEAMATSWLTQLPQRVIDASPDLSVLSAGLAMLDGDLAAVRRALAAAERALGDGELSLGAGPAPGPPETPLREPRPELLATIAIYRASLAQAEGDPAETLRHAERALALASPDDHLSRGAASGFIGLATWALGDVTAALGTYGQAVEFLHAAGNVVDELSGSVVLADLWRASGQPSTGREVCERALRQAEVAEEKGDIAGRAVAELQVALAEIDIEAGDLAGAELHVAAAETWWRRTVLTESASRLSVAQALLARARGDFATALAHLDEAERLYRPGFVPDVRPLSALRARFWISQGALQQAAEWARQRGVSVDDDAHPTREFDLLTLVRLLLAELDGTPNDERFGQLMALLRQLHDAADASGRSAALLEIRMLTALARDAVGRRPEALTTLTAAWAEAPEPHAHVSLFLEEGPPMIRLLQVAGQDPVADHHARRVLAAADHLRGYAVSSPTQPGSRHTPDDQLSTRELQVLALLDSDLGGPDIARSLFISPNTLRTHTKHIFTKLGVSSRRTAVVRARERGLLPPAPWALTDPGTSHQPGHLIG